MARESPKCEAGTLEDFGEEMETKKWSFVMFSVTILAILGILFQSQLLQEIAEDASSTQYLLSAMAQSQAAIIAIVIALTIFAAQMTSSNYTSKMIDVILRYNPLWILLLVYLTSIVLDLVLLALVGKSMTFKLRIFSSAAVIMMIISLGSLFWFVPSILRLIRPVRIIDILVSGFNSDRFLAGIEKNISHSIDEITALLDIVVKTENQSIAEHALKNILEIYTEKLSISDMNESERGRVLQHANIHFLGHGIRLIDQKKRLSLSISMNIYFEIFKRFPGEGRKEIEKTVNAFEQLAIACTRKDMFDEGKVAVAAIYLIGKQMIELEKTKEITKVFDALEQVEAILIEKEPAHLRYLIEIYSKLMHGIISKFVKDPLIHAIENGLKHRQGRTLEETKAYIENQMWEFRDEHYKRTVEESWRTNMVSYLTCIGIQAITRDIPWITETVTQKLLSLKKTAEEKKKQWAVQEITDSFEHLNEMAAER
ncbi:MAG: DUF2254 domain-containing protein [Theionarchaea archaeon]|nr:MAG: hypothetical protein AYK18_12885 [Theionarchaea archaeon DG-70]MBU7010357.1 DUF2254 domain-containing protein [Theionarchaea archaeon]